MLVSAVQQSESAIYILISPLFSLPPTTPPSHTSRSSYSNFTLAIHFAYGNVYTWVLLSIHPTSLWVTHLTFQFIPPSRSPCPSCPQVHSLRLRLYSCPPNRSVWLVLKIGKYLPPIHIHVLKYPTSGLALQPLSYHPVALALFASISFFPCGSVATRLRGSQLSSVSPGFPQWMSSLPQSPHHHGHPKHGEKEISPNRLPPSSISSLPADEK